MAEQDDKVEMINNLLEEISRNTFQVGSSLWVDVLHINNPASFYVRPRAYSKYLPLLQTRGRSPEATEINIGEIYIFKSKLLKCKVRGKIISFERTEDDVISRLFALDVGCFEDNVPLRRLWTTVYPLQVPSLVTLCQLADCEPRGEEWDHEAVYAMRNYVEGERAKMIIRSRTQQALCVELYNSCPDDIATLLVLTDYTTFGYTNNSINRFTTPQVPKQCYPQRILKEESVIHVRMQAGNFIDQFFVTPIEEYQSYLTDRNSFTGHVRSQPDLTIENLKVNTPVGVYHYRSNKFERGIVKVLMPEFNRAVVQLVDIGSVVEDAVVKMKAMPDWYLRFPPRAICCILHSSHSYNGDLTTLSRPGTEFLITIKKVADDTSSPNAVVVSLLNQ